MYHVDNSTGVPVMPNPSPVTSKTVLFFTEGGNGVPPTYPGPDWFNAIQSELLNILRAAGLDPDKMDNTQILAALKKLFLSRSNPFGDIKADGEAAIATALANLGIRESNASLQVGSLIIKFGNSGATVPVGGYQFSFPTPFPNACYALVVTGWQRPIGHTGRNKVGATLTATDNIASTGFDYIAIGG
ncbi:gp53-like domain-containing protein [Citrobacter freundii]